MNVFAASPQVKENTANIQSLQNQINNLPTFERKLGAPNENASFNVPNPMTFGVPNNIDWDFPNAVTCRFIGDNRYEEDLNASALTDLPPTGSTTLTPNQTDTQAGLGITCINDGFNQSGLSVEPLVIQ